MTQPPSRAPGSEGPAPRRYHKLSDASWELARAAYLSGLSAPVVAARFGLTVAALRKRATRHGWTKAAYANGCAPPVALEPDVDLVPPTPLSLSPAVLARTALTAAAQAAVDGRPREAGQHARAGLAMARLCSQFPEFEEVESVHERQWGYEQMRLVVREQALDLAQRLLEGRPLPPVYQEVERIWAKNREVERLDALQREAER